jgi:hypothetical protein
MLADSSRRRPSGRTALCVKRAAASRVYGVRSARSVTMLCPSPSRDPNHPEYTPHHAGGSGNSKTASMGLVCCSRRAGGCGPLRAVSLVGPCFPPIDDGWPDAERGHRPVRRPVVRFAVWRIVDRRPGVLPAGLVPDDRNDTRAARGADRVCFRIRQMARRSMVGAVQERKGRWHNAFHEVVWAAGVSANDWPRSSTSAPRAPS